MSSADSNILIISLKQDLKHIIKLIDNIPEQYNKSINSWLYPFERSEKVNISYVEDPNISYLSCLELLIDRLYVFINIVVNYLEFPKSIQQNVASPSAQSFGNCINKLWISIIQHFSDKEEPLSSKNSMAKLSNQEVQTDGTVQRCDSCSQASTTIKEISKALCNTLGDCETKKTTCKLSENVFNITQFGSMLNLTTSLKTDLDNVLQQLCYENEQKKQLLSTNKQLENNFKSLQNQLEEFKKSEETIKNEYKEKIDMLRGIITTQKSEYEALNCNYQKSLQKISETYKHTKTLHIIIKTSQTSVKHFKEKVLLLTFILKKHQNKIKSLEEAIIRLSESKKDAQIKYEKVFEKYSKIMKLQVKHAKVSEELSKILKNMQKNVTHVSNRLENITHQTNCNQEKISGLFNNVEEQRIILETLIQKYRLLTKTLESKKQKKDFPDKINEFQLQGIPLYDMTQQIQENSKKIRELEAENKKYLSIINKFKKGDV